MKICNAVKRMTSTGTVSTGTRARISRAPLTQLIASTALVAPFAVGPAFAQSTLSIGSAPAVVSGSPVASLTGNSLINTNTAALSIDNTGGGAALSLNFDGIIRAGTITGATLQSATIAGATNINTSGTITGAGGATLSSNSAGAAVSITNTGAGAHST